MEQNGYIDIEDIPRARGAGKYPWQEWEAIPQGKALEITDLVRKVRDPASSLGAVMARHNLRLVVRNKGRSERRVWVLKR